MTVALIDADCVAHAVAWNFPKLKELGKAWRAFSRSIRDIEEAVWADHSNIVVKGPGNYRDYIYSEYKAHRVGKESKVEDGVVNGLRDRAVSELGAIYSYGRESDDFLRIWSIEAENAGEEYVVCSNDKDLYCIPGKHFSTKTHQIRNITKAEAERHYWEQILKGDMTDNIPGLPGIGPVKAKNLLKDCDTTEEYKAVVERCYKQQYGPDTWKSWLLSNGKMIHIQQHVDDYFTF